MHLSVCIKPQFTLTPSSSSKPLFNRFPLVFSCEPHAEVSVAKIRTHYSDLFAKCFLDVSPTYVYTHISFSKGTLWKLNCVPFSKYWPQPLAMHLLPFLRGVVTSSFIGSKVSEQPNVMFPADIESALLQPTQFNLAPNWSVISSF